MSSKKPSPEQVVAAKESNADLRKQIEALQATTNDGDFTATPKNPPFDLKLKSVKKYIGHFSKVCSLAWKQDSTGFVSVGQDGKLIVWDVIGKLKIGCFTLNSQWVLACDMSPQNNFAAAGGLDNKVTLYDMKKMEKGEEMGCLELIGHNGYIGAIKFMSPTGILSASGDRSCMQWDIEKAKSVRTYSGHPGDVISLSLSKDRNMFLSSGCEKHVRMWDPRQNNCITTFTAKSEIVWNVLFFPNDQSFAICEEDGSVKLFDIRAYRMLSTYALPSSSGEGSAQSLGFSHSGRVMFVSDAKRLVAWDVLNVNVLSTFEGFKDKISCVSVSPNGLGVLTGSWDKTIQLFA